MNAHRSFRSSGILLFLVAIGCDREQPPPPPSAATSAAALAPPAAGSAPAATPPAPSPAAGNNDCPAGRWEYDYADQFLETLTRNTPGARVVEERGRFVCTITGRESGRYECEASPEGVKNVFEANAGPLPMRVIVELKGSSKAEFESAGPNKWKTTSADLSQLRVTTKASVGGNEMPMPIPATMPGMDRAGTVLEWKCEGGKLKLKPQVQNMDVGWLTLKPAG